MGKSVPAVDANSVRFTADGLSSAVNLHRFGDTTTGIGFTTSNISHYISGSQVLQLTGSSASASIPLTGTRLQLTGTGGTTASASTLYVSPSLVTSTTNPAYFTYLAAPAVSGSFIPSTSYTLYIADAPALGTSKYAMYVGAGTSGFAAQVAGSSSATLSTPAYSFLGDLTTGIGYTSSGAFRFVSGGAAVSSLASTGLTLESTKVLNFAGEVLVQRGGVSHLAMDSTGLMTIANGYAGNVTTSTVSLARSTISATTFPAGPVTANLDYFPLGGKSYYVNVSYTGWAIPGTLNTGLVRMDITFTPFTTITFANLTGIFASQVASPTSTTINVTLPTHSVLVTAPNVVTVEASVASTLAGGQTWRSGNTLTVHVTGIIIADK